MLIKNQDIYVAAEALNKEFGADCELHLPVKINYWLQKNIKIIANLAQEIDESRIGIAKNYGTLTEQGDAYQIPPEKLETAQNELNDLFGIEQDVNLHQFSLDEFDGIDLTYNQMSAIMLMIKDETE